MNVYKVIFQSLSDPDDFVTEHIVANGYAGVEKAFRWWVSHEATIMSIELVINGVYIEETKDEEVTSK
jgi:hypothetical protein